MLHFDARVVFSKPRSGYCTITATIPLWPPSALRRTRLESTGLGIVWPWLPHPIIPSNRTGLSNHHGSVYSFLPKALTHTVPSAWNSLPTLLPHIGSFLLIFQDKKKKKKAANRNVLVEGRRLKILEKEGVTDGEEWE